MSHHHDDPLLYAPAVDSMSEEPTEHYPTHHTDKGQLHVFPSSPLPPEEHPSSDLRRTQTDPSGSLMDADNEDALSSDSEETHHTRAQSQEAEMHLAAARKAAHTLTLGETLSCIVFAYAFTLLSIHWFVMTWSLISGQMSCTFTLLLSRFLSMILSRPSLCV